MRKHPLEKGRADDQSHPQLLAAGEHPLFQPLIEEAVGDLQGAKVIRGREDVEGMGFAIGGGAPVSHQTPGRQVVHGFQQLGHDQGGFGVVDLEQIDGFQAQFFQAEPDGLFDLPAQVGSSQGSTIVRADQGQLGSDDGFGGDASKGQAHYFLAATVGRGRVEIVDPSFEGVPQQPDAFSVGGGIGQTYAVGHTQLDRAHTEG